jgi:hypothetical protein
MTGTNLMQAGIGTNIIGVKISYQNAKMPEIICDTGTYSVTASAIRDHNNVVPGGNHARTWLNSWNSFPYIDTNSHIRAKTLLSLRSLRDVSETSPQLFETKALRRRFGEVVSTSLQYFFIKISEQVIDRTLLFWFEV